MEGVIVVWFQWFTDSVAQWRQLDEDHYALDDDNTKSVGAAKRDRFYGKSRAREDGIRDLVSVMRDGDG